MARKSTKKARFDALSQREQNRERKRKLKSGRNDGNKWGHHVLSKLEALKDGDNDGNIEKEEREKSQK
ncbi:hypothetical protein [Paenisporosarcina sp. NPDC076898]|uniref:hypothetical protein n=1 Tax=unclassified Paenisporosarcina TaxID=2642018 RepID=UPI003D049B3D